MITIKITSEEETIKLELENKYTVLASSTCDGKAQLTKLIKQYLTHGTDNEGEPVPTGIEITIIDDSEPTPTLAYVEEGDNMLNLLMGTPKVIFVDNSFVFSSDLAKSLRSTDDFHFVFLTDRRPCIRTPPIPWKSEYILSCIHNNYALTERYQYRTCDTETRKVIILEDSSLNIKYYSTTYEKSNVFASDGGTNLLRTILNVVTVLAEREIYVIIKSKDSSADVSLLMSVKRTLRDKGVTLNILTEDYLNYELMEVLYD